MNVAGVIVGDEVLSGHVVDANGPLLAAAIRDAGHRLQRLVVVPDDIDTIAREIRTAFADDCELIVTSGGLGPTHDDVTLEGVAAGLAVPLSECVAMRARIDGWIQRATAAGVREQALGASWLRRMALAPEGAKLLECSIPVPAFAIDAERGTVCILPGPPTQFAAALHDAVLPAFLGAPGDHVIEEVSHPYPESMLAQALADLAAEHGEVAIGSYPLSDSVLLRLKGPKEGVRIVADAIIAVVEGLDASPDGRMMREVLQARRRHTNEPPSS